MLKRKFSEKLLEWKKTKGKECLLVKGARQVGKTFTIEQFGRENYKSFIYINFLENPEYTSIFQDSFEAEEIYKNITLNMMDVQFVQNNTLIFLDEIQECPNARTALKNLAIDDKYDVIASGSLMDKLYSEVAAVPVEYEKQLEMHSLDFEEFLWAIGINEQVINYFKEGFHKLVSVSETKHMRMMKMLREYVVIGGMPSVVKLYVETKNFGEVHKEQERILNSYFDAIMRYAPLADKRKSKKCFMSLPKQISKKYKKFMYSLVQKRSPARKFESSLDWLKEANLIRFSYNTSEPELPIEKYEIKDQFKIYANDIGIFVSMFGFEMKKSIIENTIKGRKKSGIYESLVADIFIKRDLKLNYYKVETCTQELEFLQIRDGKVRPIELKFGGKSVSINNAMENHAMEYGYKLVASNIDKLGKRILLPIYMAMFL